MLARHLNTLLVATTLVAACHRGPKPAPPVNTADLPTSSDAAAESLLVDVRALDSTIRVEARYATANNFTGAPLPGYEANRALLRREAAQALARVQRRAHAEGVGLKVWDAYRPARATLAMVEWTERTGRQSLVRDGYIASRSRHNLGLAIDLTLVDLASGAELAMGTPFDTFSAAAHTANAEGDVARNRRRLVRLMEAEGFRNYAQEWWHFSYDVPDPRRFDLPVRPAP
jgi:zinc D-Ala-D-Ala dipeptidase